MNEHNEDPFARIAAQRSEYQKSALVEPPPPRLPALRLPAGSTDPAAVFVPRRRMQTAAALDRALARERRRFERFLRDLAPPVTSPRIAAPLKTFDWRLETAADRRDFLGTLNGAGNWERVAIPHYAGPVGRATAYYRTTFTVTHEMLAVGALFVCFKGVDYKAQVFVNGALLGAHEGFFAPFEFEGTAAVRPGDNVLLVRVENDAAPICDGGSWGMKVDGDKLYAATGPGWDDPELGWHHCPPGMGIYQPVTVEARPRLHLADVFVRPLPEQRQAEVWVEVFNGGSEPQEVRCRISVFGQNFPATVFRDREFTPPQKAGPRLNSYRFLVDMPRPRLWDLDAPWLYQVQVTLPNGDALARQFGMRSFRMAEEGSPKGRFLLNGREIRLRGANTMGFEQQDVMRGDAGQLRDDILLARIGHLNFWRLTQRPVQDEVYTMCDRLGLLTQTDLPLFGQLPRAQFGEAIRQSGEMERLVRNHPCNVLVSYINEPFPASWGNKSHRQCTRAELEMFFTAASQAVHVANPDRVIKPVDGDYDPPAPGLPDNHCYTCWYDGHGVELGKLHKGFWQAIKPGWFHGCGEFGAEGLDGADLMRRRYPRAWLPQSPAEESAWSPARIKEAQTGRFHYLFFDTQRTLDDWVAASQRHQAWATRIMTEAFRRDHRLNTCAIHLFIDAWPAGWMKAIMDCERRPKPAYFAYREALTPLMANIRSDRQAFTAGETMRFEFWVCNDTPDLPRGARLRYQLEVGGQVVFAQQARARVATCTSTFQGFLQLAAPDVAVRRTATLRLALVAPGGRLLHDTDVELEIFPRLRPAAGRQAVIVGAPTGRAARLARELGLRPTATGDLYLVDDFARYAKRRRAIEAAADQGATVVFLELPAGEYEITGGPVKVDGCGMGSRHFVSRATGHPLVAEFRPDDFKLWHDPAVDRISPLLHTTFSGAGWTPILSSGNGGWSGEWGPALAAAEKRCGAGVCRICQVTLAGRIATNPVAERFARLLTARGQQEATSAMESAAQRGKP